MGDEFFSSHSLDTNRFRKKKKKEKENMKFSFALVGALLFIGIFTTQNVNVVECKYNMMKIMNKYHHTNMSSLSPQRVVDFSYTNCGPSDDPLQFSSLALTPEPFDVPGTIYLSGHISLKKTIESPLVLQLKVLKITGPFKLEIPCIDGYGSCTYADACELLPSSTNDCDDFFKKNKLPCTCPFAKGEFSVNKAPIKILVETKIPEGKYEIIGNLQSEALGHVGCLTLTGHLGK